MYHLFVPGMALRIMIWKNPQKHFYLSTVICSVTMQHEYHTMFVFFLFIEQNWHIFISTLCHKESSVHYEDVNNLE